MSAENKVKEIPVPGWDGWVGTNSGKAIGLNHVALDQINIEDIARGLSNQCRFTGQINEWYSVAEHCMWVADILPPRLRLCGLMHDAAEAYITDLSSPIKRMIGQPYRQIEECIALAIGDKFGLSDRLVVLPQAVKDADRIMLMTERDALQKVPRNDWGDDYENSVRIPDFWVRYPTPKEAYDAYLQRFKQYAREAKHGNR